MPRLDCPSVSAERPTQDTDLMVDWLGTKGWMEKLAWRGTPAWSYYYHQPSIAQRGLASGPDQHSNCAPCLLLLLVRLLMLLPQGLQRLNELGAMFVEPSLPDASLHLYLHVQRTQTPVRRSL